MKESKSITYTEDKNHIAIDPKGVDHDKLTEQLNKTESSTVFVEYNPIRR